MIKGAATLPIFRGLNCTPELRLSKLADTSGLKPEEKELISKLDALEAAKRIHSKSYKTRRQKNLKSTKKIEEVC